MSRTVNVTGIDTKKNKSDSDLCMETIKVSMPLAGGYSFRLVSTSFKECALR
jgi:hypothetical protein